MIITIKTDHHNASRRPILAALLMALFSITGCDIENTPQDPDIGDIATTPNQPNPPRQQRITGDHSPSDPLVLRSQDGITIRGLTISADPAIELYDCRNITIIGCDLTRVVLGGCENIRIVNSYLHNTADEAIYLDDCRDVLVQGNRIERVKSGVLAHQSTGIRVAGNYCRDVIGPLPGGQLVQFDKVTGPGNAVTENYAENYLGASNPEDMISLYQSHGTEASPILIENNYLVGDPLEGSEGKSKSGSGIMLGDNGGSWQLCQNNTLISPGQVGIGIASGENIVVQRNLVIGQQSDVSNVGLYVWNQYTDQPAGVITIRENVVHWVNNKARDNPYWNGGGFSEVIERDNSFTGPREQPEPLIPKPPSEAPQAPVPFVEPDR